MPNYQDNTTLAQAIRKGLNTPNVTETGMTYISLNGLDNETQKYAACAVGLAIIGAMGDAKAAKMEYEAKLYPLLSKSVSSEAFYTAIANLLYTYGVKTTWMQLRAISGWHSGVVQSHGAKAIADRLDRNPNAFDPMIEGSGNDTL